MDEIIRRRRRAASKFRATAEPTASSPSPSRLPSLRSSCTGERRLDPEYVPFQRAVGWIVTASMSVCLLVAIGVLWLAADHAVVGPRSADSGVAALSRWASPGSLTSGRRCTTGTPRTCSTPKGIEIRSGVWWREIISVPRSRVQHIDVSQGPMERSYGLGRLVLYTAGTAHSRVELQGLSYAVAFALRNHLLPRGSDDAV